MLVATATLALSFPSQAADKPPAYTVDIVAPAALKDILTASLDLLRWRDYESMTPQLLERLVREARTQATEALATEGYFSPEIEIATAGSSEQPVIRLVVEPGIRARVRSVSISFQGEVLNSNDTAGMARARDAWSLQENSGFRQADWEAAKKRAVAALASEYYVAARVIDSRAAIDPETNSAELAIELDSGPRFYLGPVVVSGLKRYQESAVLSLVPFQRGDPYSLEKLEVFQRRLSATNYFASTQLLVDADVATASAAPLRVSVVEAPSKRLEIGLGYSTDTLYRSSISWRDANLFGTAARFRGELRVESRLQRLAGSVDLPEAGDGWGNSVDASLERTDIQNLETRTAMLGATRRRLNERDQFAYGASAYLEQQAPEGAPSQSVHALYPRMDQTWRTIDNLVSPRRGTVLHLHAGAGVPGVSSQDFIRGLGQFAWYLPLSRNNDFMLRGEVGAVLASSSQGIPQALLFRTGGDTTVRGYAYQSLGVRQGEAIVGGRYYTIGSAEATHWVSESWGVAAFVDAGNAADNWTDLRPRLGYGLGARVRSPIGPFRFDVAYGQEDRQIRIHFSAGLAF